jgi:3-isopropylmalate dehydrogenase
MYQQFHGQKHVHASPLIKLQTFSNSAYTPLMSTTHKISILAGDGIGPEVMDASMLVLDAAAKKFSITLEKDSQLVGGAAIDATGSPLPEETVASCQASDAILFGSVGGPKWENLPPDQQPERGALLPLRKKFNLYANLRPGVCLPSLTHASPVKNELIPNGFDVLCVRELTGGIYFGQPKSISEVDGELVAIDTMVYKQSEIVRIAHIAFTAAMARDKRLCSVDKANVLQNSVLWRQTVIEVSKEYPEVELSHLYVDNAAMQLIKQPGSFDVIVTGNLFGDILSDEMAMISGSLGMLPSASLGNPKPVETTDGGADDGASGQAGREECKPLYFGMYEPSGGSAPDIAGQGVANPIAQILSAAMMLRYSLGEGDAAAAIEAAVDKAIDKGLRTGDIFTGKEGETKVGTVAMAEAIADAI